MIEHVLTNVRIGVIAPDEGAEPRIWRLLVVDGQDEDGNAREAWSIPLDEASAAAVHEALRDAASPVTVVKPKLVLPG